LRDAIRAGFVSRGTATMTATLLAVRAWTRITRP
jgi:hypothetical protein